MMVGENDVICGVYETNWAGDVLSEWLAPIVASLRKNWLNVE